MKLNVDPHYTIRMEADAVIREVAPEHGGELARLLDSPLWAFLCQEGLVEKITVAERFADGSPRVLVQRRAAFPLSPGEWSFAMARSAARCLIRIQIACLEHGYTLKDGHAHNLVFFGCQPRFVDIGSLVPISTCAPRAFDEEFIGSFLTPIATMAAGDPYLGNVLLNDPLPRSRLSPSPAAMASAVIGHIARRAPLRRGWLGQLREAVIRNARAVYDRLPQRWRQRVAGASVARKAWSAAKSPAPLLDHVRTLRYLDRLAQPLGSKWGDYHDQFAGQPDHPSHARLTWIADFVAGTKPATVIDFAGNAGYVSRIIARKLPEAHILCADYDSNAIDSLLQGGQADPALGGRITPAWMNFVFPHLAHIRDSAYRLGGGIQADTVVALAVTHHLLLSQGIPIDRILHQIRLAAKRHVLIEFMPLGLWAGEGTTSPEVPAWYNQEMFTAAFERHFILERVENLERNRIAFCGRVA